MIPLLTFIILSLLPQLILEHKNQASPVLTVSLKGWEEIVSPIFNKKSFFLDP